MRRGCLVALQVLASCLPSISFWEAGAFFLFPATTGKTVSTIPSIAAPRHLLRRGQTALYTAPQPPDMKSC